MNTNESISLSKLIGSFVYLLIFPFTLLLLAGDWRWPEGWFYSIVFYVMCSANLLYLYFKDPALLKERFGSPVQKEQKPIRVMLADDHPIVMTGFDVSISTRRMFEPVTVIVSLMSPTRISAFTEAAKAPTSWTATNPGTSTGRMPANESIGRTSAVV